MLRVTPGAGKLRSAPTPPHPIQLPYSNSHSVWDWGRWLLRLRNLISQKSLQLKGLHSQVPQNEQGLWSLTGLGINPKAGALPSHLPNGGAVEHQICQVHGTQ